jgi:hypothetical protein
MPHPAKFDFTRGEIELILRNSYQENMYYGVDKFESKRLKILMAKFGCRHTYHTLPGHLTATFYPFSWDRLKQCFRMDTRQKVTAQLNTLEEVVVMHTVGN